MKIHSLFRVGSLLPAALLALVSHDVRADAAGPTIYTIPKLAANPDTTMQGHLDAARRFLAAAKTDLERTSDTTRGPLLEKALAGISQANTDLAAAVAYVKAHPETNALKPGPAPAETSKVHSAVIPPNIYPAPGLNLIAAIEALNKALNEFVNDHSGGSKGPVIGEIGGLRVKIMDDISQASGNVLAAIAANAAQDAEQRQNPSPGSTQPPPVEYKSLPPAPAPSPATTGENDSGARLPTAVAGLAMSLGLALGGLRFFARKGGAS